MPGFYLKSRTKNLCGINKRLSILMTKKKTGRPESFNAEYFSHSVHENDELKVMMMKYKSEGFMAYYRLFECVTKADLHRIELKNEVQKNIFIMNMGVNQEIIDFLFDLLLQTGLMNAEQWEKNQTIYLDKFVKQFKKLWYDRDKSIPDADGKYNDWNPQKDGTNKVSRTGNGYSIVEDSIIEDNTIYEEGDSKDSNPSSIDIPYFKNKYTGLDVQKSFDKYITYAKQPSKESFDRWCLKDLNAGRNKKIKYEKNVYTGSKFKNI
jgi:hypothetical protein